MEDSCPLDAAVESVLPGVHHRMDLHSQQLLDLHRYVRTLEGTISNENQATRRGILDALGSSLKAASAKIAKSLEETTTGLQDVDDDDDSKMPAAPKANKTTSAGPHLMASYPRLSDLFDHWFGCGLYESIPGGINHLETSRKSSWRSSYTSAQKKQFSRAKVVMTALKKTAQSRNISFRDVCDEWEDIYAAEAGCRLSKMVTILQEKGVIRKMKARGKASSFNDPLTI